MESNFEIIFYELENGNVPVADFIKSLDKKMIAQVLKNIDLLKMSGYKLGLPHAKHIGNGLHELRMKSESGITRIFYFFYIENKIILTNGFIKKTQKLPKVELEIAIKYKKDYIEKEK